MANIHTEPSVLLIIPVFLSTLHLHSLQEFFPFACKYVYVAVFLIQLWLVCEDKCSDGHFLRELDTSGGPESWSGAQPWVSRMRFICGQPTGCSQQIILTSDWLVDEGVMFVSKGSIEVGQPI